MGGLEKLYVSLARSWLWAKPGQVLAGAKPGSGAEPGWKAAQGSALLWEQETRNPSSGNQRGFP